MRTSRIPVDDLKSRLALRDLLPLLGFPAPRSPRTYRSRCLLHGGDNPSSFSADLNTNMWFCHACQRGGDAISLVEAVLGVSFQEAITWMATQAGLSAESIDTKQADRRYQARRQALGELGEEEASYVGIEQDFRTWFRAMFHALPTDKAQWDAKTYTRSLWIEHCHDVLDEISEERATQFMERQKVLYAT